MKEKLLKQFAKVDNLTYEIGVLAHIGKEYSERFLKAKKDREKAVDEFIAMLCDIGEFYEKHQ